jgi:hypothetical protein
MTLPLSVVEVRRTLPDKNERKRGRLFIKKQVDGSM